MQLINILLAWYKLILGDDTNIVWYTSVHILQPNPQPPKKEFILCNRLSKYPIGFTYKPHRSDLYLLQKSLFRHSSTLLSETKPKDWCGHWFWKSILHFSQEAWGSPTKKISCVYGTSSCALSPHTNCYYLMLFTSPAYTSRLYEHLNN